MEILKFKPQSVILTVAPTCAGKTHFVENVLIPRLKRLEKQMFKNLNIQHLSSDNFRREMIGYNSFLDDGSELPLKNDPLMNFVSEQAFEMLKTKLKAVTSFPVNADFVIVDTTGMSKDFRDEIAEITNKANYTLQVVLFDYKNREDYFKYSESADSFEKKKINDSVKRFKEKLSEVTRKDYGDIMKIKSNDFSKIDIEIDGFEVYRKYFLSDLYDYVVIGDVHGCYDELKELLYLVGYQFDSDDHATFVPTSVNGKKIKIIFVGDIVDKGEQIAECINFVHKLVFDRIAHFVKGNHENFNFNYLKGSQSYLQTPREFINTFLSTVGILEKDENLRLKFYELIDESTEFCTNGKFIVTHAPCKNEYLGKVRGGSLKAQRNFKVTKLDETATADEIVASKEKDLAFLKEESRYNQPYHIMGHILLNNVVQFNNKVMIDTGCASGGKLTAVLIGEGKLRFYTVKSKRENKFDDAMLNLFSGNKGINLDDLDPKERTRIKYMCLEKVNYISGTMAPADKDKDAHVLESLDQAIKYYKDAGVKKLILQPKHMGSRGNVYLFTNPEQCYVTTRNGYRMRDNVAAPEVLIAEYKRLIERYFNRDEFVGATMILLDAEILPWRAIGKGLIDQQFTPVSIAVQSETMLLSEHSFEDVLRDYNTNSEYQQYMTDRMTMNKDELSSKYGYNKERSFRSFYDYDHWMLSNELESAIGYAKQVELFGGDAPFRIEPFSLLKVVFENGTEKTYENDSNIEIYNIVSDQIYAVMNLEELNITKPIGSQPVDVFNHRSFEKGLWSIETFYKYITEDLKMEGIVVKPEIVYTKGVAPYLKVRNENYLTIVYGHNYKFENKFEKLIHKKSIGRKLKTSIKEFELGLKMLKTPYSAITPENESYKQLLAQMIVEVEKEKELDPRL